MGGGEINNENKVNRSEVMVTQERVPRTAVLKQASWMGSGQNVTLTGELSEVVQIVKST